jgi:hypothetical protein
MVITLIAITDLITIGHTVMGITTRIGHTITGLTAAGER